MRLTFERAIEKYCASMIRRCLSIRTINYKVAFFKPFAEWLSKNHQDCFQDMKSVSCEVLEEYIDFSALKGLKPGTMRQSISNFKVFFGFLYKNDLIEEDPTRKILQVRVPKREIVYFTKSEIFKVLDDVLHKIRKYEIYDIAVRDYWMIRVAYVTGWRSSDAVSCLIENIDWDTGEIYIPDMKGGKDGYVYMDEETSRGLKKWYYSNYPNGKYLWYSMSGGKSGKKMEYPGYQRVFRKFFKKGPHRMRASLGTYLAEQGVDVKQIKEILNHENIQSTMRYVAAVKTTVKGIHRDKNPFSNVLG